MLRRRTRSERLVAQAVDALRIGGAVVVVDDATRENEGDLVVAAELADAHLVNLLITEARGLVCVAMAAELVDRLGLPQMVVSNTDAHGTAFTVSVDAVGTGTGISAADRAATARALASPAAARGGLRTPGHVFPLRAAPGGLRERRGHTEASVELMALTGLAPAAVICEILDADGNAADRPTLEELARRHGLPVVDVADIAAYVVRDDDPPTRAAIPTRLGQFAAVGHRDGDGGEHLALICGDLESAAGPLVRLHAECITGDVLGSLRCDCRDRLDLAMQVIAEHGAGVVLYIRGCVGRGIGIAGKLRAYALQDNGYNAGTPRGEPSTARDHRVAADMLRRLGMVEITLLSTDPTEAEGLESNGIHVNGDVRLKSGSGCTDDHADAAPRHDGASRQRRDPAPRRAG